MDKKEIIYAGEKRYKQAHLNYFATKWKRLDLRGKSSKDLKDIINELLKAQRYLLRCIRALDYKESQAKKSVTAVKNKQKSEDNKLVTQAKRTERLIAKENAKKSITEVKNAFKREISDLLSKIRYLRGRIAGGLLRERSLRAEVRSLKDQLDYAKKQESPTEYLVSQVNYWKDKFDEANSRANKNLMRRQRRKVVKKVVKEIVEKPRSQQEMRALKSIKFLDQPLPDRILNTADIALKTATFMESNKIDHAELAVIMKGQILKSFTPRQIGYPNRRLAKLMEKGYLSRDSTGVQDASKYYFLTPMSVELIKAFEKEVLYGKSKI